MASDTVCEQQDAVTSQVSKHGVQSAGFFSLLGVGQGRGSNRKSETMSAEFGNFHQGVETSGRQVRQPHGFDPFSMGWFQFLLES